MHEPLRVNPTQCMQAHPELAGIVGHDDRPGRAERCVRGQQSMVANGTPERTLGGDTHGVRGDFEGINAEPGQVRRPRERVAWRRSVALPGGSA